MKGRYVWSEPTHPAGCRMTDHEKHTAAMP
ncbi:hypothetical protein STSP_37380 [Streptomyces jeddahensis]|uniref:Uncharacterized protein n=1 Tax=Streptomyces jeddahensis TaxID=1716141 RepID=A0A177HQ20_9ACTN|nr:hypothetical protein STSP_37380 [Streptomyces jeddahensis]